MEVLSAILNVTLDTVSDVMPIAAIIFGFQFIVLRQKPANLRQILMGFVWVLAGLSLDETLVEIIEIADHPWFVACQFHPEKSQHAGARLIGHFLGDVSWS